MAKGPLSGIKVVEYCSYVAGPYCAKLLADMGAEVLKIEKPEGDGARRRGPFKDNIPDPDLAAGFLFDNTNKKGITLNIESATGRRLFKRLVMEADVLLEDARRESWQVWDLGMMILASRITGW